MESGGRSGRDAVLALLDEADAVADRLASLALEALTPAELLAVLARREVLARRQPAIDHRLLNRLVAEAVPTELGGTTLAKALAHRLKISQADARRRLDEAADLGPGSTLAGAPLPPKLPCAAAAQAQGLIGGDHVRTIRWFFATLPDHVDLGTRIDAERELARLAAQFGPEHFRKAAERMMTVIDQDGDFTDADRQRRRGLTFGRQSVDGMTPVSGNLTPEARAVWNAIMAKLAAPGMCNADDAAPCVDGQPSSDQVGGDTRRVAQRQHDALLAAGRAVLASGALGQLNGLPVTVIVSTTLAELESAAGQAVTAGGPCCPCPT